MLCMFLLDFDFINLFGYLLFGSNLYDYNNVHVGGLNICRVRSFFCEIFTFPLPFVLL